MAEGEKVRVADGEGTEARALVQAIAPDHGHALLELIDGPYPGDVFEESARDVIAAQSHQS